MDTIEVSNLNRQFLFRQSHVGQSKAKVSIHLNLIISFAAAWLHTFLYIPVTCYQVARDAVLRFRPQISITSYHANVKNSDFNVDFFKQFSVVLNGLDNLDARRHVNRLCLAADVPLVESGTTGFLGQVTSLNNFSLIFEISKLWFSYKLPQVQLINMSMALLLYPFVLRFQTCLFWSLK